MPKKKESQTIETERLILRARQEKDIPDMLEYFRDEEVRKYLGGYPPKDEHSILKIIRHRSPTEWAITLKANNKLIGECHINKITDNYLGEVGYILDRKYWGKGYATESVIAVEKHAIEVIKLKRLCATIDNENYRSKRLIEKLGFTFIAVLPEADFGGRIADIAYYSKLFK